MENYPSSDVTPQDVIAEEAQFGFEYVYASTGQRFLNFLIDNVLMRFGLNWATGYAAGILIASLAPSFLYDENYQIVNWKLYLISYLISIVNYLFYYTICEKLFKGITLGKLITGTKAIREDGGDLTFRDALMRSLSRIVPFEPFSAFNGHPWHDQWTKTMVVKTR
jgi:uncharacterized RDD family membrane protein YckC